ncbi:MAG TPA: hypothetical protein VH249_01165 [Xanthobacteraceae bacterium]|jgi:hypothetical protein|nr:hypothetical protein [Xanthobacteraceae bacterium]
MNREPPIKLAVAVVMVAMLACVRPDPASAQGTTAGQAPAAPPATLTREQFEALAPTAIIEIDGKSISKQEFLTRRARELERAIEQADAMRSTSDAERETRRKAFIDGEKAKLAAANKAVQAEVDRLRSADAAAHGPDWDARRRQAAALLDDAAAADVLQRSRLEKQAADLLAPASGRP